MVLLHLITTTKTNANHCHVWQNRAYCPLQLPRKKDHVLRSLKRFYCKFQRWNSQPLVYTIVNVFKHFKDYTVYIAKVWLGLMPRSSLSYHSTQLAPSLMPLNSGWKLLPPRGKRHQTWRPLDQTMKVASLLPYSAQSPEKQRGANETHEPSFPVRNTLGLSWRLP